MAFSSLLFLLYFLPVAIIIYQLLHFSRKAQNIWLLIASLVFYAWDSLIYTLALLGIIALNYGLGIWAGKQKSAGREMGWLLAATLVVNLGPLFLLKYLPPVFNTISGIFNLGFSYNSPQIPLGIAFISLQGISYVMDIYKGKAKAEKNPVSCALYLSFFPTLFAGPIVRYQEIAPQINKRRHTWKGFSSGFCRFLVGLGKYVLLARPLSALSDAAFHNSNISGIFTTIPVSMAILGFLAFLLQIYYLLSGFSDMAIGLGGMFGFVYPENFNYPVLAISVTDFWKRSFITLGVWFEEYVNEPLSAKSKNRDKQVLYFLIMWLLIGVWLGPSLPNLLFGFLCFVFLIVELIVEFEDSRLRKGFRHLYVGIAMSFCLIALRTNSVYEYTLFMGNLFAANKNQFGAEMGLALLREFWPALLLGFIFLFPVGPKIEKAMASKNKAVGISASVLYTVAMLALAYLVFVFIVRSGTDASIVTDFNIWSKLV